MSDIISQVSALETELLTRHLDQKESVHRDRKIRLTIAGMIHTLSEEVYVYGIQALASDGEWRVASTVVCLAQDPLDGKWFPTSDEAVTFQEEIELKCATRLCRRRVSPIEEFVPGAKEVVSDEGS